MAAAFAIHLGSRVDLLPGSVCLRLLEIPDRAPASRPEGIAELLRRELGARPEKLFETFDREPFDSALLTQRHRARLPGGEPVVVELSHPELRAADAIDRLRARVDGLVAAADLPAAARAEVAGFERRLDLTRRADALSRLAEEQADSRRVEVPRVHRRLSTGRVLVVAALDAGRRPPSSGPAERARRLCRAWLAMALDGELFPLEPRGRNVAWLEGGRVAFLGGPVHRLPRAWQGELRDYLAAVAARRPARAALAFLDLLPGGGGRRRLRDRLRHTDPFRDRGWDVGGDLFARQVLAHWRTAAEAGHELPEGLAPFYRGLFLLNHEVRRLAGAAGGEQADEPTAVRDGLREARLLLLVGEMSEEVEAGRFAAAVDQQVDLLAGLPRKLDRILTLAAGDDRPAAGEGRRDASRGDRRRGVGGWPATAACLLALTAVTALAHQLAEGGALAAAQPVGALLVLLLGGLALAAAARRDDP